MVFDGSMDPSAPLSHQAIDMATVSQATLDRSLAACWGIDPCPVGDGPVAAFDTLAEQLRAEPLTSSDGQPVGIVALQSAASSAAAIPFFFGRAFVEAIAAARAGDGDGLLALGPGAYTDKSGQSSFDAQMVILCNDETERLTPADATELARALDKSAPRTGLSVATGWGIGCQAFPPAKQAGRAVRVRGSRSGARGGLDRRPEHRLQVVGADGRGARRAITDPRGRRTHGLLQYVPDRLHGGRHQRLPHRSRGCAAAHELCRLIEPAHCSELTAAITPDGWPRRRSSRSPASARSSAGSR